MLALLVTFFLFPAFKHRKRRLSQGVCLTPFLGQRLDLVLRRPGLLHAGDRPGHLGRAPRLPDDRLLARPAHAGGLAARAHVQDKAISAA